MNRPPAGQTRSTVIEHMVAVLARFSEDLLIFFFFLPTNKFRVAKLHYQTSHNQFSTYAKGINVYLEMRGVNFTI